jgi:hypothetical protein
MLLFFQTKSNPGYCRADKTKLPLFGEESLADKGIKMRPIQS